jgi:hypothetical protein
MKKKPDISVVAAPGQGPRMDGSSVLDLIKEAHYFSKPGLTTTVCVLELKNGAEVVGTSNPLSPENFDHARGRESARRRAIEALLDHEGYHQKVKLMEARAEAAVIGD